MIEPPSIGKDNHVKRADATGMKILLTLGIIAAILVAGVILSGIFFVVLETLTGLKSSSQDNRIIWNTKNTTRFVGVDTEELQVRMSQATFPGQVPQQRPGSVILVVGDNALSAIAATSLIPYVNGPLFTVSSWPNSRIETEIRRLNPMGAQGVAPVIVIGEGIEDVMPALSASGFQAEAITGRGEQIATAIDSFKREKFGGAGNNIILAPQNDFRLALPATSWMAHSGDSIFFVLDGISNEVRSRIALRENPHIFTIGGIANNVAGEFETRVIETGAGDIFRNAVFFAKFRDENAGFGWGMTDLEQNAPAYHNFIIGNVDDWRGISSASFLAKRGKFGCTLLSTENRIPPAVESFIWKQKPGFYVAPNWGPFNHAYIIGDLPALDFLNVQGRVDWSQEISSYRFLEDGMSGLEMLVVVWITIGILGGIWALFAVLNFIPNVPLLMKITWPMIAFILGPVGLIIFILSYQGRTRYEQGGMVRWQRPSWNQAMAATSMGIAFAASTMIAIAYLLTLFGLPLFTGLNFPAFYLGSPMVLMMVAMYVLAFLVSWLIFHIPMIANLRGTALRQAVWPAALVVLIAMTSVSIGMMSTTWWYQLWSLPSMAEEDEIMWFGVLFYATLIGAIIAYVPNYFLVRSGRKSGAM